MVLQASAHAKHDLKYHFVWCPKYRRLALKGNIGKYVQRVIYEVAQQYDFTALELAVMPDHLHLFISALRWTHLSRQFFSKIKLHLGAVFMLFSVFPCPMSRGVTHSHFTPALFRKKAAGGSWLWVTRTKAMH